MNQEFREACVATAELVAQQIECIVVIARRDASPGEAMAKAYKNAAGEARRIGERIRTGEIEMGVQE